MPTRVYYDPDTDMWIHADTGFKIRAWDVRNTEPHASEIKKRQGRTSLNLGYGERIAGAVTSQEGRRTVDEPEEVPIPPSNPQAEEDYVNEILSQANYA
jgi:hypothetical protein